MLSPKKTKFRKYYKRNIQKFELHQASLIPYYSTIGLKSLEVGYLS